MAAPMTLQEAFDKAVAPVLEAVSRTPNVC